MIQHTFGDRTELIVDNFAGGGGASLGIERALGRPVDIAINHDAEAIAMHAANHPATKHFRENIWQVDPREATGGRPVGLAWFSPDCTHFSKAKGGAPIREYGKQSRALAWVVVEWAKAVQPRVMILENVEEFEAWGPVLEETGRPCPVRKGETFREWIAALRALGYAVDWRQLRACDYGTPTIRKRLFVIARCDGQPIVWPAPTHGKGLIPWRTAAECIEWGLPCPSIFERKRPLADATLRRIARGTQRYVIEAAQPFIVPIAHYDGSDRIHSLADPLRTVTTHRRGEFALCAPTLIQTGYGEAPGQAPRAPGLHKPLGTVVGGGSKHALVAAFLAQHNGGAVARPMDAPAATLTQRSTQVQLVAAHLSRFHSQSVGSDPKQPVGTVLGSGHDALVTAHLMVNTTGHTGGKADAPVPTITTGGHIAEVRAFLLKYYGTAVGQAAEQPLHSTTAKARFGLVIVEGEPFEIADIGMRMLTPRELYHAQGFPDSYRIEIAVNGKPLTKTAQIRLCGNAVPPEFSAALTAANYQEHSAWRAVG